MRDIGIFVPTRGREENALRLIRAVTDTAALKTDVVFAVDDDDPSYDGANLRPAAVIRGPRRCLAGWVNDMVAAFAEDYRFLVFLGDDHVPVTPGWDAQLADALGGRMGVAYGNDLHQRETWPTAAMIPARVITALGYMCPPGPEHMYLDCFWKRLGTDLGCLKYLPDVIIEHCHPDAGKASRDASYDRTNAPGAYARDDAAYNLFLKNRWPGDLIRLKAALGL